MKRKSILVLTLTASLMLSIFLVECGNTSRAKYNTPNNNYSNIQRDTNSVRNDINNTAEATKDEIGETAQSIKYGAANLKDDITNAGYKLNDSAGNMKNYFSGKETDYSLGGDLVRVYEYNNPSDLENDINKISPNGLTVRGTNANYTAKPYYYRKGNSLIIYEGKEPAYVDEFGRLYGNTLRP